MSLPEVCVVFLLRRGAEGMEVLLGESTGADDGAIAGIGGRVAPGEEPREAAARAVRERVGVEVEASALRTAGAVEHHFPTLPAWSERSTLFVCLSWRGIPAGVDGITPRWFALDAVPYRRMRDDASRWLPGVLRGGAVDARFTFGADLATVVLTAE